MTKKDIVRSVTEKLVVSQVQTKKVIQETFDAIIETLVEDAQACQVTNFFIYPIGTIGVGLEQDDGSFNFLRSPFELLDDGFDGSAFFIGQSNNELFRVHDKTSVSYCQ